MYQARIRTAWQVELLAERPLPLAIDEKIQRDLRHGVTAA
jgi:hypothetical protein